MRLHRMRPLRRGRRVQAVTDPKDEKEIPQVCEKCGALCGYAIVPKTFPLNVAKSVCIKHATEFLEKESNEDKRTP